MPLSLIMVMPTQSRRLFSSFSQNLPWIMEPFRDAPKYCPFALQILSICHAALTAAPPLAIYLASFRYSHIIWFPPLNNSEHFQCWVLVRFLKFTQGWAWSFLGEQPSRETQELQKWWYNYMVGPCLYTLAQQGTMGMLCWWRYSFGWDVKPLTTCFRYISSWHMV